MVDTEVKVTQLTNSMFTNSNKAVGGSLQASQPSGTSGRLASMAPLNRLILIAAELLSSGSFFPLGFYVFPYQCFSLGFYIFFYQYFSSPPLELLTISVSAILALSPYIALF